MKTDREVIDTLDHVEMIRRPRLWPRWPVLPLKRPRVLVNEGLLSPDGVGVLLDGEGYDNIVFLTDLFTPDFSGCERIVYDSPEAIVDDGWVVD